MAASSRTFSRIPLLRHFSLSSSTINTSLSPRISAVRSMSVSASLSTQDSSSNSTKQTPFIQTMKRTWKPLCLYFTQGKCTLMNDPSHLDKFNHNCTVALEANLSQSKLLRSQHVDYFLVIDLEGKVEILEFPVMMIDAKTMQVVDFFHSGNWDIKTKIPQQCQVCSMAIPPYFMEWINLKDIYLNFYNRRAPGMRSMLNELQIQLLGSHHLGIDDTKNISRVVQRMLADGALLQITARRNPASPGSVEFLFKNRIR